MRINQYAVCTAVIATQLGVIGITPPSKAVTCVETYTDGPPLEILTLTNDNNPITSTATTNTSCGSGAVVGGTDSNNTALGASSQAGVSGGTSNTAVGNSASAGSISANPSDGNTAVGTNSQADGGNATAIGAGALATFENSTAIGSNSSVTRANQIVIGTTTNSYTLPGLASGGNFIGSTNQTDSIQFVTVDSNGTLGTNNFSPTAVNNRITTLENSLSTINKQIENVGAMAAALSAIPNVTANNKTYGCGIGTGGYGGGWAGAAGCTGKIASNLWINGAVAFTGANSTPWGSTSSVSGRLGLFMQWGGPK